MAELVEVLEEIRSAFLRKRNAGETFPVGFYLNMLDQQVIEAREHMRHFVTSGNERYLRKALEEIADCFSVGWQAIADNTGNDPAGFIVDRLQRRVMPRVDELHERDLVAGRTGYKPEVKA